MVGAKMPRIQVLCGLATEVIVCYVMNISQRRRITSPSDMRKSAPNGFIVTLRRMKSQSGSIPMTAICQSTKWSKFNTNKTTRMMNGLPWKTWKGAWMLFPRIPKHKFGITWHPELEDKVEPIVQHVSWVIGNCDKGPLKLKASMLNTVHHYKGIHDKCHSSSRCQ